MLVFCMWAVSIPKCTCCFAVSGSVSRCLCLLRSLSVSDCVRIWHPISAVKLCPHPNDSVPSPVIHAPESPGGTGQGTPQGIGPYPLLQPAEVEQRMQRSHPDTMLFRILVPSTCAAELELKIAHAQLVSLWVTP